MRLISTEIIIINSKIMHVFSKLKNVLSSLIVVFFLSSIVIEGFSTLSFFKHIHKRQPKNDQKTKKLKDNPK